MPQWKVTLHVLTKLRNPEPTKKSEKDSIFSEGIL
jgi:hypothetical protein